ncbi:ATP-binding protein [Robiginitomaculum antarcticum]|uniref:ATP-binding protein n=1 Tax=Robiginitomaculum antarcticum TaxID=437507 RepID=UPI00036703BA|nr:hypothetical protein [Robiginitomaculum antarcticum]
MALKSKHNILILGDARMAFPVMKAMAKAGHAVFAGVSIYSNYMEWSRYLTGSFWHEPLEPGTDEAFPRVRDWLLEHPEIDTIQPVNEASIRFVTRHRDFFESQAILILPNRGIISLASDKTAMFDLCRDLNGPVAPYAAVHSLADIETALETIGYPFILKPSKVDAYIFDRKALILKTAEDFKSQFPHWPDIHPELLMQRYVSGPRHSVIYSAYEGRLLGALEIRAGRTHENDGTGYTTYGITVEPNPIIRQSVETLVKAMNYSFTGCLQYIVDPNTGDVTFMEINPRVSLARLAECGGLPHSLWGLSMAHGTAPSGFNDPWSLPTGVEYVWTKGELTLLAQLLKSKQISLREFGSRLTGAMRDAARSHHAIFDITDPLPAIGVYTNKIIRPFVKHWRQRTGFEPASAS